ncbi:hypothetical protein [Streptomyces sp. NPDC050560]|uniref:hypothetical protein n=1 Tax=Streptomyces sp. NPDC050560 TaxID=3365630 RepID=UPI003789ED6D
MAVAAVVGFCVWLRGARPGLRGSFEGERDLGLLYQELPCLVLGVPAVTLAVWALVGGVLRHRVGGGARAVLAGGVAAAALAALAWGGHLWLGQRVDAYLQDPA